MPKSARAAMLAAAASLARYPDPNGFDLKAALAERYGVPMNWITLGNGSNDILEIAALALLEQAPRDRVFYRVAAGDGALISGYGDLPAPDGVDAATTAGVPQLYAAVYQGEPVRIAWMARKVAGPRNAEVAVIQVAQTREARNALAQGILWQGTLALMALVVAHPAH
ncbi:hypothetical protein G6F52_013549 [Rhizopus delemar]|nr:hypothetical protein G6F52_013549 [Rhizopus delemar]